MQSNHRNLGILLIVIGLILLGLIVYFGFFQGAPTETLTTGPTATGTLPPPSGATAGTTTPGDIPRDTAKLDVSKEPTHQVNSNDLAKIAMAFSERFGSFSSQSDYGNFTDLKIIMTDSLKTWVDGYVQKIKSANKSTAYYGIVTHALTTGVKSFDDKAGQADIIVTTERNESTATATSSKTYKQNLELKFKKVSDEWLVDEVYWQK